MSDWLVLLAYIYKGYRVSRAEWRVARWLVSISTASSWLLMGVVVGAVVDKTHTYCMHVVLRLST